MCGILGVFGDINSKKLIKSLVTIKNRGENSSGIYLQNKDEIIFNNNIDLDSFNINNNYNVSLGHNLLSIFKGYDNKYNRQPYLFKNLVLTFNGEIYNFNELVNYIKENSNLSNEFSSDSELLIKLIYILVLENDFNLLNAIKKTINMVRGDYSFGVFDGEDIVLCRDKIGVKPLYYGFNNKIKAFASEKKALWTLGICEINTLYPGHILYNWEDIPPKQYPWNNIPNDSFSSSGDGSKGDCFVSSVYGSSKGNIKYTPNDYYKIQLRLKDILIKSIEDRTNYLNKIGLIFSGGVDSSILAIILKDLSMKKGFEFKLYSVGTENSKDLRSSIEFASKMDMPIKTLIITEDMVKDSLNKVLIAIEEANLMKLGVGMTTYLSTKLLKEDNCNVALSGQGADELFGGYNRYLKSFDNKNPYLKLDLNLKYDIENIFHVNLERDDACSMINGVELRVPFLDERLVKYGLNIPPEFKIKSKDDNLRKHILRDTAFNMGLPHQWAYRPKKAAQYGSGIHKILEKKVLKGIDLNEYYDELINLNY